MTGLTRKQEDQQILKLRRQGLSLERIGWRLGRSHNWVWLRLKELGEPQRRVVAEPLSRAERVDVTPKEVRQLLVEGLSVSQIAARFGVSYHTVYRRLKEEGKLKP